MVQKQGSDENTIDYPTMEQWQKEKEKKTITSSTCMYMYIYGGYNHFFFRRSKSGSVETGPINRTGGSNPGQEVCFCAIPGCSDWPDRDTEFRYPRLPLKKKACAA